MFPPSRLYAIIDAQSLPGRDPAAVARQLLRAGVKILQYRKKGPFTRDDGDQCCLMARLAREHSAVFLVNDRVDVALVCDAAGVHLGQDDLPPEVARRLLDARGGHDKILGFSTHSVEQAREAGRLPVDYIAIGPVFATATKENPDPVVGLETVASARRVVTKPLVAIGGITLENARAVIDSGADAVAVIGGLLNAADVEGRAREFLQRLHT